MNNDLLKQNQLIVSNNRTLASIGSENPILELYTNEGTPKNLSQPPEYPNDILYNFEDITWATGDVVQDAEVLSVNNYGQQCVATLLTNLFTVTSIDCYQIFITSDFVKTDVSNLKSILTSISNNNDKKCRFVIFYCVQELISAIYEKVLFSSTKIFESSQQEDDFKKQIFDITQEFNTSDIHFECSKISGRSKIRYRKHGDLVTYKTFNYDVMKNLIEIGYSVVGSKIETGSTITGTGLNMKTPQDGKINFTYGGIDFELRVGTLPRTTEQGIDFTMRVLKCGKEHTIRLLDEFGYETFQLVQIKAACIKRAGIILVCGVTGSGKNESMIAQIDYMNKYYNNKKKFVSAEVPVERDMENVTQVNIDGADDSEESAETVERKLNKVLEAMLRNDPDVLLTNEIRNKMTAKFAIEASRTGHPFLTTLHCSNSYDAPARLSDLEITRPSLASANVLTLIIAQNLVKKVCPHCSHTISEIDPTLPIYSQVLEWCEKLELTDYIDNFRFANKGGCKYCHHDENGIIDRTPLAEILTPNPTIREFWGKAADEIATKEWLGSEYGVTQLEHGIIKMCRGEITPDTLLLFQDPLTSLSDRIELGVKPFNIKDYM